MRSKKARSHALASPTDPQDDPQRPKPHLRWMLIALCALVGLASVLCWRWNYNSDGVLTGLMARSIIARGERPLFVWSVGYQGVLINAYANALVFKIMGVGPRQLSVWPTLVFWALLVVFFGYIRRGLGERVALVAVAFLALSNPLMVAVLTRNVPNYPEVYLMGLALFVIERDLLAGLRGGDRPYGKRCMLRFAALGFIGGFGAYTYGQIYLFIASVAAHLGLVYGKDMWQACRADAGHRRFVLAAGSGPAVVGLVGLFYFVIGKAPAALPIPLLADTGLGTMVHAAGLGGIVALADLARRHGRWLAGLLPGLLATGVAAVVGYGPALYERYVRHHQVTNRSTVEGTLAVFAERMAWAVEGNAWHLNLLPTAASVSDINIPILLITSLALGTFVVFVGRQVKSFFVSQQSSHLMSTMGPLLLLPIVNLIAFGLSSAVVGTFSSRYMLSMWFFYALAFGWFFATPRRSSSRFEVAAMTAMCLALLGHGASRIIKDVALAYEQPFDGEEAIGPMQDKGVRFGYAGYWSAYTVNFFTNEEIVLQPTFSAYCPHYGPMVAQADDVVIVDPPGDVGSLATGTKVQLGRQAFVTGDYLEGQRNTMIFLKRQDASLN